MKIHSLARFTLLFLSISGLTLAGPVPDFPFIAADGYIQKEVPPDKAKIQFKVLAFSKNPEEATSTTEASLAKLIGALETLGVPKSQIRATDISKSVVRNKLESSWQETEILGYNVSRDVGIELLDQAKYPDIIRSIMVAANVGNVASEFETSKKDEIEAELLQEACSAARKKAAALAKGAGVILGPVHAVTENDFSNLQSEFGFASNFGAYARGAPAEKDILIFVPSTIPVQKSVKILYKLVP